jgi:NAD(P)H-nitrite reductase large subunit
MSKQHVILGAGPAGIHAIETIRLFEPQGSTIHLVCDEPPYARMVLPYYISGEVGENHLYTADEQFFARYQVIPHLGVRASRLDPSARKVVLSDGSELRYDTLLIATGSSPIRPSIPGLDLPGVTNLWTLNDARKLLQLAGRGKRVLFIGAGFIGFIVLNALYKRGCRLFVVEIAPQILPRMLDAEAATLAERWLQTRGVEIRTGTSVTEIQQYGQALRVFLNDGGSITVDGVVVATGVRPNMDFLQGSGIETDFGILVDHQLRTNLPDVFAAGDCAQGPDLLDSRSVHAIQSTAIDHGRLAGANMAGQNVTYEGSLSMNVLDICGLHAASFGKWQGQQEIVRITNPTRPIYRKLVFEDDRMVGGILLGPTEDISHLNDVGMVKGFIQSKVPLGPWKEYLKQHQPLDLRRPYLAAGVAPLLLRKTLLPRPSEDVGHRPIDVRPDPQQDKGPYHEVFAKAFAQVFQSRQP